MKTSIGKYLFFIANFAFWMFLALFTSKLIVDNITSGHQYSNAIFSLHYLKTLVQHLVYYKTQENFWLLYRL